MLSQKVLRYAWSTDVLRGNQRCNPRMASACAVHFVSRCNGLDINLRALVGDKTVQVRLVVILSEPRLGRVDEVDRAELPYPALCASDSSFA